MQKIVYTKKFIGQPSAVITALVCLIFIIFKKQYLQYLYNTQIRNHFTV